MSQAFNPATVGQPPTVVPFAAIWDTGATASAITQNVVDQCGLAPIGMTKVQTADGEVDAEIYLVNIGLPNQVGFMHLQVTKAKLGANADVLIGMDIISQGDFTVTNKGGITVFSYRYPSAIHIDFVKEFNEAALRHRIAHSGKGGFRNRKR